VTSPSTIIPISEDQIDVWFADLDIASTQKANLYDLLSPDERDRASKLRAVFNRDRFITSRGILRTILGRYLFVAPHALSFSYGPYGKPSLPEPGLHFNLSHSHGRALFAFSSTSPLGVDLELVRPLPDLLQVGAAIFSLAEAKKFESISPQDQPTSFFKCWTRKEALIKALGTGLSYPLDQFSVSFDEPARLLSADDDRTRLSHWHLYHLEPEPHYFAAIATQQTKAEITLHRY
jgi:4'-phosphopantetheinyl transferase